MQILITGVAGFIGFHTAKTLLEQGHEIIGIDSINDYYDINLKQARLKELSGKFTFEKIDLADKSKVDYLLKTYPDVTHIIHLAAQPGVRYSLENPFSYIENNLMAHTVMMEYARHLKNIEHFVYASSSSVYGGNEKQPFSIEDNVDHPLNLYAATKRADELMTNSYCHLYGFPATGLRFFTVYGPWGRPDMAPMLFASAISKGKPITVYNEGKMKRDFTYIDDIVSGIILAMNKPSTAKLPHRVFNLGNHKSEELMYFINLIEESLGQKAQINFAPLHPGDAIETYADINATTKELGFLPTTSLADGIPRFIDWFVIKRNAFQGE